MPKKIIKLENVSFTYSHAENQALQNINLEIGEGEFVALMGANGAGKTTFCRLLNGLIPHSLPGKLTGTVTVDGVRTSSSSAALLAAKTGMVFDDPETQLFTARVSDEVAFALENLLMPPDKIREKAQWALEAAGLAAYADYAPSSLSGGQKQRLAIAAAVAMAGKVLVLDEPTSQLDPAGAGEVLSLVCSLCAQQGLAVVMASSSGDEAAEYADSVIVLKDGRLAARDTPRRIFADETLMADNAIQCPQVSDFARSMALLGEPLPSFPITIDEAEKAVAAWHGEREKETENKEQRSGIRDQGSGIRDRKCMVDAPCNSGQEAIRVEGVTYGYDASRVILNDINFSINENEFVIILGRNGSGKTTLLKNISGLLRPSHGRIVVRGKDTRQMSVAQIAGEIGYVMQECDRQLFESTVYDEIAFVLKQNGSVEKAEEVLAAAGLQDKRDAFPLALNRGDRVKTVFAAVLAMRPKIIMLDEPVAGQDNRDCRMIMDLIAGLHQQGYTILMVTHNISVAAEYGQRIVVMKDGGVYMDGSPDDIFGRADDLASEGILPPPVTRLSEKLRGKGIPLEKNALSPNELAEMLIGII